MEYIARNIKICIWDLGFGPLAWALGTLGPLKKYENLKKPV